MKAIVVSEFGDAEVLRLDESVDTPSIASDEILIQTTFSPINYTDIHGRNGKNKAVKTPYVPGTEAVGEIIEVGADVSGFEVGQRVASYTSGGSYAEITKAKAILSYAIPEGLEDRDACCLTSGITAYNLIKKVAGVNSDDTVLIHSAAGGAGILATQIARVSGAKKVIGTVGSDSKKELVLASGADAVFNYYDEGYHEAVLEFTEGYGATVILDSRGSHLMEADLALLADFGRLLVYGQSSGQPSLFPSDRFYRRNQSILGYASSHYRRTNPGFLKSAGEGLLSLLGKGQIKNIIGAEYPLEDANEAHKLLESRSSTGKILLRM